MAVVEVKFVGIDAVTEVMTGGLRRIGEAAVNLLGSALTGLGNFAAESFQGALEAQQGIDALGASIQRLGEKAPVTMAGAEALADQFKNLVGGSDDAVLAMTNVGLRFDKISAETFPQFIKQSADLAAVLKTDPVKASEILGKALQDLSVDGQGSIGRLKAAGVAFTDEQEKLIESLVKSGDVAGAQQVLFDALAATTGGAAAAAAGTAAGQWAIFQETIADAGEGVALALLPALTQLASDVLPKITPIIIAVADAISEFVSGILTGEDPIGDLANLVWNLANTFGLSGEQAKGLFMQVIGLRDGFDAFAGFITTSVIPALQGMVAWVVENWPAIQAAIADGWAQIQPVLQAIGDFIINVVIPAFNQAVQWVIANWPMIQATIATVMAQIQAVIATVLDAINAFWSEWGDEIMAFTAGVFEYFSNIFSAFSKAFSGDWRGFGEDLRKSWDLLWENVKKIVAGALEWFTTQDWGKIGTDIISGIVTGIETGASWVSDALMAAGRAAWDAITGFFDSHSDSRLMMKLGADLMGGMASGITGGTSETVNAMRNASNSVVNTVNSGGNTINYYGVQADMHYAYNRAVAGAF